MTWIEWMNNLSRFKYAVHLMPTHAAGTFALNCAYHGIPCIGYEGLDTQELCFPDLSVDMGDLKKAKKITYKLKNDLEFYKKVSILSIENYKKMYSEKVFLENWNKIVESLNANN
jgi:hypothetical protein